MNAIQDPDSGLWIVLSGLFILIVAVLALYFGYESWSTQKDLTTASAVVTAYFIQAVTKRMIRGQAVKTYCERDRT